MGTFLRLKKPLALLLTLCLTSAETAPCLAAVLAEPLSSGTTSFVSLSPARSDRASLRNGGGMTLASAADLGGAAAAARAFDGSSASSRSLVVSFPAPPAPRTAASVQAVPARGNGISLRTVAPPSPALPPAGRPPLTLKDRFAGLAGALGMETAFGAVPIILYGPEAAAFFATGFAMKVADHNSDLLKSPQAAFLLAQVDKHADLIRFCAGAAMGVVGVATLNPILTLFGLTFTSIGGSDLVMKPAFNWTKKALDSAPAVKADRAIGAGFDRAAGFVSKEFGETPKAGKEAASAAPAESATPLGRDFHRMGSYLSTHKAVIAKTAVAVGIAMAASSVASAAGGMILGNVLGILSSPGSQNIVLNALSDAYHAFEAPGQRLSADALQVFRAVVNQI